MSGKRLGLDLRLQKRFGCGFLTFNRSKSSCHFFSEMLTGFTSITLEQLEDPLVLERLQALINDGFIL